MTEKRLNAIKLKLAAICLSTLTIAFVVVVAVALYQLLARY